VALEFPVATVPNKQPYDHRYTSSTPCTNTSFSKQPFGYSCVCNLNLAEMSINT